MAAGHIGKLDLEGIGRIWMAGTDSGLCRIVLRGGRRRLCQSLPRDMEWIEDETFFKSLSEKLARFTSGKSVNFDERIDLRTGTPFQQSVWKTIAEIPRGGTRSYAWIARSIGKPDAYRAVANACGANPLPILTPCHRVIASDGSIGGFSCGTGLKRKLLSLEGQRLNSK